MLVVPKHSILHPAGVGILNDPDLSHERQIDFKQCVHCQTVWKVQPGSGRLRGFCMRCNGPICGPSCMECRGPWEQQNEDIEAGRTPGSRVVQNVPFLGR